MATGDPFCEIHGFVRCGCAETRLVREHVPCHACCFLVHDAATSYGVRCVKGDTSDQVGDYSCYRPPVPWPPAWVGWR